MHVSKQRQHWFIHESHTTANLGPRIVISPHVHCEMIQVYRCIWQSETGKWVRPECGLMIELAAIDAVRENNFAAFRAIVAQKALRDVDFPMKLIIEAIGQKSFDQHRDQSIREVWVDLLKQVLMLSEDICEPNELADQIVACYNYFRAEEVIAQS